MTTINTALEGSIRFTANNTGEMLRISPDGFYVRGVKLEQDAAEARKVFDAVKAWLQQHGMLR